MTIQHIASSQDIVYVYTDQPCETLIYTNVIDVFCFVSISDVVYGMTTKASGNDLEQITDTTGCYKRIDRLTEHELYAYKHGGRAIKEIEA